MNINHEIICANQLLVLLFHDLRPDSTDSFGVGPPAAHTAFIGEGPEIATTTLRSPRDSRIKNPLGLDATPGMATIDNKINYIRTCYNKRQARRRVVASGRGRRTR